MKLIIGLGNPGKQYEMTRHNFGFIAVDKYVQDNNMKFQIKNKYEILKNNIFGETVIFLKPLTYMNLSGEALIEVVNFYKVNIEDILVIYDDLDSDFGKIKIKKNSSSGGHNGIKNIIAHLKTQDFARVKLGIKNEFKRDTKTFVLSNFSKDEQKQMGDILNITVNIIDDFIKGQDILKIMNKYN